MQTDGTTAADGTVTVSVGSNDGDAARRGLVVVRSGTVRDTVRLAAAPLTDSTALAALPLTRRVYADSTFRAVVSGYRPRLDSLAVFPVRQVVTEQVVVTRTVRKPARFSLGLQVGYGTDFRRHGPYVGIGLQWNWAIPLPP